MGLTGGLCRAFYYGLNNVETVGLDKFLKILDRRKDIEGRERGLVTGMIALLL
jgi:monolysocardiolipin acyltransferase